MTFYNRFIQFVTIGFVCYLAYRMYEIEVRMSYIEARPMLVVNTSSPILEEEDEEDDEQRVMTYEPTHTDKKILKPEEFEPPMTPTKLKKLTVSELSQIAQEKNINITDSEGKRLTKNSIIDKISKNVNSENK